MDIIGFINTQEPVASWTTAKKVSMLNDLCETHGYQEQVLDPDNPGQVIDNPETKKAFVNRMIRKQLKIWVNGWRKSKAQNEVVYDEIELENT